LLFFLDTKRIIHGEILKKVTKLNDEVAELERQLHIKNNEIEILKNKIEEVKVKDYLTGLYLKKYFEEIFENEIARAKRHKLPLTLVFADIDNSKFLKESYGPKVFDKIIESLSKLFISLSRKEDVISRYGDSEFAFLLPNTTFGGGTAYSDKMQKTINKTLFEGSITVSITFAVIEFEKDDTLNTMFQKAYKTVREARGL
jgi:diguanylate cyclase (GGDEF) domain